MPNYERLNKHPQRFQPTALESDERILVSTNRDAGLTVPDALPVSWNEADSTTRSVCLWYARNTMTYFDKAKVARHIIGCEILANEAAGVKPVITKERADELWAMVFSK